MKDGDGTTQFAQLHVKDSSSGDTILVMKKISDKVEEVVDKINKQLSVNEKSLKTAEKFTISIKNG